MACQMMGVVVKQKKAAALKILPTSRALVSVNLRLAWAFFPLTDVTDQPLCQAVVFWESKIRKNLKVKELHSL